LWWSCSGVLNELFCHRTSSDLASDVIE
jgi:hypothetical protein